MNAGHNTDFASRRLGARLPTARGLALLMALALGVASAVSAVAPLYGLARQKQSTTPFCGVTDVQAVLADMMAPGKAASDYNGDGQVDLLDFQMALNRALGKDGGRPREQNRGDSKAGVLGQALPVSERPHSKTVHALYTERSEPEQLAAPMVQCAPARPAVQLWRPHNRFVYWLTPHAPPGAYAGARPAQPLMLVNLRKMV